MINKNQFKIKNTKKVLHKVGKQWIVVSAVLLGLVAGGSALVNANASTIQGAKPQVVVPGQNGSAKDSNDTPTGNKGTTGNKQVSTKAKNTNNTPNNSQKFPSANKPASVNSNVTNYMKSLSGNASNSNIYSSYANATKGNSAMSNDFSAFTSEAADFYSYNAMPSLSAAQKNSEVNDLISAASNVFAIDRSLNEPHQISAGIYNFEHSSRLSGLISNNKSFSTVISNAKSMLHSLRASNHIRKEHNAQLRKSGITPAEVDHAKMTVAKASSASDLAKRNSLINKAKNSESSISAKKASIAATVKSNESVINNKKVSAAKTAKSDEATIGSKKSSISSLVNSNESSINTKKASIASAVKNGEATINAKKSAAENAHKQHEATRNHVYKVLHHKNAMKRKAHNDYLRRTHQTPADLMHAKVASAKSAEASQEASINSKKAEVMSNKASAIAASNANKQNDNFNDFLALYDLESTEDALNDMNSSSANTSSSASQSNAPASTSSSASQESAKSNDNYSKYILVDKNIALHSNKHFTKKNNVRQVRAGSQLKINKMVKDHGAIRFLVMYRHHKYFITGNRKFVSSLYVQKNDFRKHHKMVIRTVVPVEAYKHARFNKHDAYRHIKKGTKLTIKRVVSIGHDGMTRFELTNGKYISANRTFVKIIK